MKLTIWIVKGTCIIDLKKKLFLQYIRVFKLEF